jgi:hypothetical protein
MVDETGNQVSTLFQRQQNNVDQFAFSITFQRLSNVWEVMSDIDSTMYQRHFARWEISSQQSAFARNVEVLATVYF